MVESWAGDTKSTVVYFGMLLSFVKKSVSEELLLLCCYYYQFSFCLTGLFFPQIITGRMPQSGKLSVLNLLTGQKSGFSPHRGDSLHRFTSNLAGLTGTWVRLAVQNFTSTAIGVGNAAQKYQKFPLSGKDLLHRGDSLDRFRKFFRAFIRPTIVHQWFKFDVIRFTGYGVIAEKLRIGQLGRIFPCTL